MVEANNRILCSCLKYTYLYGKLFKIYCKVMKHSLCHYLSVLRKKDMHIINEFRHSESICKKMLIVIPYWSKDRRKGRGDGGFYFPIYSLLRTICLSWLLWQPQKFANQSSSKTSYEKCSWLAGLQLPFFWMHFSIHTKAMLFLVYY